MYVLKVNLFFKTKTGVQREFVFHIARLFVLSVFITAINDFLLNLKP